MNDCQPSTLKVVFLCLLLAVEVVEWWLGKTNRLKAGSIVELCVLSIMMFGTAIYLRVRKK